MTDFRVETATDGVATITFDRPERLNPLGPEGLRALSEALDDLRADPEVRALILTGRGRAFCSGASLEAIGIAAEGPSTGLAEAHIRALFDEGVNPIQRKLRAMPKPVVCAVNGVAAGGGVGLALAGDVVLAVPDADFRLTFFPNLGIIPDLGCSWFMPRAAGYHRALAAAVTGEPITAEEARACGMVWKIVDHDGLAREAAAMAARLAAGPVAALPQLRAALAAAGGQDLDTHLDLERDSNVALCGTPDFAEGVRAFLEKRRPSFGG